jgi:type IV pilus assembly protein PilY1
MFIMKSRHSSVSFLSLAGVLSVLMLFSATVRSELNLPATPLTVSVSATPLTLLTAARDHKLYYEAYNDASDLNNDGFLDIGYKPNINYYGYFDSYKCYNYNTTSNLFEPVYTSIAKTCTSTTQTGEWSGDYLNYLTMSRMDALRRVLYGGYRSTDSDTATVLERAYIPQDAHSWGKEYTSVEVDGYDIRNYTPLPLPSVGDRHVFANTTVLNTNPPLLRVLTNSSFRVWEWLSIERPVAGTQCATGNNSRSNCAGTGGTYDTSHPNDHNDFLALIAKFANADHLQGSGTVTTINESGNPFGDDDNYITVFTGTLTIKNGESGNYQFAVNGDDAVDVSINGVVVAGWYGGHGACNDDGGDDIDNCVAYRGTINLNPGQYTITFLHEEVSGSDSYKLYWKRPGNNQDWQIAPALNSGRGLSNITRTVYDRLNTSPSTLTDYTVRVRACVSGLLEPECRGYPVSAPTKYKPIGILQQYGEDDSMAFGLITGSYAKNTSGGVLRKNISSLKNEINLTTGQLSTTVGVIQTLDKLKITGFGGSHSYNENCGVPEVGGPLSEGRCRMWGNPIGEVMYEGLRYLGGQTEATGAFNIATTGNDDATLGLPLPTWLDPYRTSGGYPSCSKPSQIVISDISPNFDTDQMPGRYEYTSPATMATFSGTSSLNSNSISVSGLGDTIWTGEFGSGVSKNFFIGQSTTSYDGAPTAKAATSFGSIRGLAPEEPSQQGGFYSASIAHFGKTKDIHSATGAQKVDTYSVALASPKPQIEFPIGSRTISLVPFGKTVGGCGTIDRASGKYQPTNTIVDFYVQSYKNTNTGNYDASVNSGRPYAKFRINYEDSEYGSDHDMDAIVEYELTATAANTLEVKLTSDYAAGGCIQHMGYVISGTTADGTYLDVRDSDTTTDVDYFLDTPNTASVALPLTNTRTFVPGTTTAAQFVPNDPLWYAAKWGGFTDRNNNNLPDLVPEWDSNTDGVPDTYFLVQNPLKLKEALKRAFDNIIERSGSAGNVTSNSTSISTESQVFQSIFNTFTWSGNLLAYPVSSGGVGITPNWRASQMIPIAADRKIFTRSNSTAVEFLWANLSTTDQTALVSQNVVNYLRGDAANELRNTGGTLRNRTITVLGDIVHSSPYFVKDNNTVFVGSNDGMLHAFSAVNGAEKFAYIPSQALSRLKNLSQIDYGSTTNPHQYFVDGDIAVTSLVQTPSHNYLVSTLGQGGKGLFALDVTDPTTFGTSKVMWEYFSATDTDLGYMLGRPTIAKMNDGSMYVIVGNGYNSTSGKAVLYLFNLTTGVSTKIDTLVASDNGLASPGVFDSDNDGDVDFIYAGDLKGNVWKFNVSQNNTNQWDVDFKSGTTPQPFFIAKDRLGVAQPITAQITISKNFVTTDINVGKRFIIFGTGSYFRTGDPNDLQIQTWYGLIDEGSQITSIRDGTTQEFNNLKKRTVEEEGTLTDRPVRAFSVAVANDMSGKNGWYFDLTKENGTAEGERIVTSSKVYSFAEPTLLASSIIPVVDPCVPGGKGFVNAINPFTGARLGLGFFDVNGNGNFTDDTINTVLVSSIDLSVGMPSEPVVVGDRLVVGGSSGDIKDIKINLGIVPNKGRISWREILQD